MNVRRGLLASAVVVVAIFAAGASGAQAQVIIDPIPGMTVASDDMISTYCTYVWTKYNFTFELEVFHDGVSKDYSSYFVDPDGYGVYIEKMTWHGGWGMEAGDTLDYVNTATITKGRYKGKSDQATTTVTVTDPITLLEPAERGSWLPPQGHVFREDYV